MLIINLFKWLLFVPVSLFAAVFGRLLNPFVVLFANDAGWLPGWLAWFQTPDNSLDGDEGWKTGHRLWRNDADVQSNRFKRYINRCLWLNRNSTMGLSISVMGSKTLGLDAIKSYWSTGDELTGNRPLHNGCVFRVLDGYWCFYWVRSWNSRYCIRVLLGWKIWCPPMAGKLQYTLNINPFMGYAP
jgi:hypothetical protein